MEMCQQYDIRFIVMHDRWEADKYKERSIEDLKARYYAVQKTLVELRSAADEELKKHPILQTIYKADQETMRKRQLEKLFTRSVGAAKEEEQLWPRYNTLIQTFDSHNTETTKVIKEIEKIFQKPNDKKKRQSNAKPRTPGKPPSKEQQSKYRKYDEAVNAAIKELGIEKPKPTAVEATAKYNNLRHNICLLFEMQKIQAEALYELQVLKGQQDLLQGNPVQQVNVSHLLPQ